MTTIALIPARAGSKRLPGKNKRMCAGLPLWQWSYYCAKAAGVFDRVWLATDDEDIREQGRKLQCAGETLLAVMARKAAPDEQTTDDLIAEWCDYVPPLPHAAPWTRLVVLQPTSPTRSSDLVRRVVELLDRSEAVAAANVLTPWVTELSGAVYAVTRDHWDKHQRLLAGKLTVLATGAVSDIDTLEDFERAERKLQGERPAWAPQPTMDGA